MTLVYGSTFLFTDNNDGIYIRPSYQTEGIKVSSIFSFYRGIESQIKRSKFRKDVTPTVEIVLVGQVRFFFSELDWKGR